MVIIHPFSRHSDSYVCFSCPFLFFSDNIYFSKFIASSTGYNHSGFREIIKVFFFILTQQEESYIKSCYFIAKSFYSLPLMMWYYGDLTIYGENRINNLVPGRNVVNKGIDYYNCFYTLYHKIYAYFESECTYPYPLLEFDLFTICDLVFSRQLYKHGLSEGIFFYSEDEKERVVYDCTRYLLEKYINRYNVKNKIDKKKENNSKDEVKENEFNDFDYSSNTTKELFEKIIEHLKPLEKESDERRYVYYFFKVIKNLFPEPE